jgi:hypothetical protein
VEEVTLNKQPDGSWQAQGPQKKQAAAWQRLWLVTGCVYLLLLLGAGWLLVPNQERVERTMVHAVTEEVRRYDGMAFAGESPDAIFRRARSYGFPDWIKQLRFRYRIGLEGDPGFNRIEREYREALESISTKQVLAALLGFVAWAVPMAVLYALGFVVDWIKRGARVIRQ